MRTLKYLGLTGIFFIAACSDDSGLDTPLPDAGDAAAEATGTDTDEPQPDQEPSVVEPSVSPSVEPSAEPDAQPEPAEEQPEPAAEPAVEPEGDAAVEPETNEPDVVDSGVSAAADAGQDGGDGGVSDDGGVSPMDNAPPGAPSVQITPANAGTLDALTLEITTESVDPDGDTVSYAILWLRDGTPTANTDMLLPANQTSKGDVWTAQVTPSDGLSAGPAATASVTIENSAPEAGTVTLSPTSATAADTLTCSVTAGSDPDGDSVTQAYSWTLNGQSITETGATLSSPLVRGDSVVCQITPNDGELDGPTVSSDAVVVGNAPPTVSSVSIAPAPAADGDALTCSGQTDDIDGDTVTLSFTWSADGSVVGDSSNTLSGTLVHEGTFVTCAATPSDGTAEGDPETATVPVGNIPPELESVTLTPDAPIEYNVLSCTPGAASDINGDAITFSYAWTVAGTVVTGETGNTLVGDSFSEGDVVTCSVTPNDGSADGEPVVSNAVTIGNVPPRVTSVSVTDPAFEGEDVECTAVGADDDNESVTFSYSWTVNGVDVPETTDTLSGTDLVPDDVVVCTATPNDGTIDGPEDEASVTVVALPTADSVVLLPSPVREAQTLVCTAGGTGPFVYEWTVNDAVVTGADTDSLTGVDFDKGDEIYCTATPDGIGAPVDSDVVLAINTAPVVPSVALSPDPITEGGTLTCTPATPVDADGDSVTLSYAWTVNDVLLGATSNTLDSNNFAKGDDVYCTVTPNDGEEDGAPVNSSTLTVSNSAPSLDSATLSPGTAYEGSTLTCTPGTSSDADGDSVTYGYSWTAGGVLVDGQTTSTLTGTYFNKGQQVFCSVTPNDGTINGSPVNSSALTISNTPPTTGTPSVTPAMPTTANTLTCTPGTDSDADGDSVSLTYAWSVNGSTVNGETGTTLANTNFVATDTVYCSVTPNDGSEDGDTQDSTPVTIQ